MITKGWPWRPVADRQYMSVHRIRCRAVGRVAAGCSSLLQNDLKLHTVSRDSLAHSHDRGEHGDTTWLARQRSL